MSGREKRVPLLSKDGRVILDEYGFYVPEEPLYRTTWPYRIVRALLFAATGALWVALLCVIAPS